MQGNPRTLRNIRLGRSRVTLLSLRGLLEVALPAGICEEAPAERTDIGQRRRRAVAKLRCALARLIEIRESRAYAI